MSSENTAISIRDLGKSYRLFGHPGDRIKQFLSLGMRHYHRTFTALEGVSLDIRRGESIGIVGCNGSGKSTLLQLICGILKPTAGTVEVGGQVSALLELGAGFNPEFTGRENVYFQGLLMGLSRKIMDQRFEDIAAFSDIGEFIDQPVRTYSSGMYLRLAFSVAIHVQPDILVVDEALAVGDAGYQAKCMSVIQRMREAGVTILFVSHDPNAVKALCDKVLWLENGRARCFGPSGEVVDCYRLELMGTRPSQASVDAPTNELMTEGGTGCGEGAPQDFRLDPEFAQRVALFRRGSGEVRVTAVELLDDNGQAVAQVRFGQPVSVRLHIQFEQACEVAVSYYIRDDKHQIITGSTTLLEDYGLIEGVTGSRKVVEFRTHLPLAEGAYNLLLVVSIPTVPNKDARFVDYIENGLVFTVSPRSPIKLWSRVYLENRLEVHDV